MNTRTTAAATRIIETNTIIPIMLPIASPDKVYALSVSATMASVQFPSFIAGNFEAKPIVGITPLSVPLKLSTSATEPTCALSVNLR